MRTRACARRRRRRRRGGLRLGLLLIPALFWSAVFATIAGLGPMERAARHASDAAQVVFPATCLFLAVLLGLPYMRDRRVVLKGGK
jgi:hypothetical protein